MVSLDAGSTSSPRDKSLPPLPLAEERQYSEEVPKSGVRVNDFGFKSINEPVKLFSEPFSRNTTTATDCDRLPKRQTQAQAQEYLPPDSDGPGSPSHVNQVDLHSPSQSFLDMTGRKSRFPSLTRLHLEANVEEPDSPSRSTGSSISLCNSMSSTSTPRPSNHHILQNDMGPLASSNYAQASVLPVSGMPTTPAYNEWGAPATGPYDPAATGNTGRYKKSASRLLVNNLSRGLNRVGSVMRRDTSDTAVATLSSPKSSTPVRQRDAQSASPTDEADTRPGWIKRRMRSATMPEESTVKDWETATSRKEDEGDQDITRPFNVEHPLHVSQDLADLPASWLEALRSQGLSESDLLLIQSARKNANDRTQASLRPIPQPRGSFSTPPGPHALPSPIGYVRRKSSTTPRYMPTVDTAPRLETTTAEMSRSGHDRRPSYFNRFSFEKDETLNEADEDALKEPTTPTTGTPSSSGELTTPVSQHRRHHHKSRSRELINDSAECSPATPSKDRAIRSSHSRRHKKRLSEQLRGFQTSFATLGDDDWAGSLTAELDKGFGIASPVQSPSAQSDNVVAQPLSGPTDSSTPPGGSSPRTRKPSKTRRPPKALNLPSEYTGSSRPWPHSPPPPPRRIKPISPPKEVIADLNAPRPSTDSFGTVSTPIASSSGKMDTPAATGGAGHSRNASEGVRSEDDNEIVTPSTSTDSSHFSARVNTGDGDPVRFGSMRSSSDQVSSSMSPNPAAGPVSASEMDFDKSITRPFIGLTLTPDIGSFLSLPLDISGRSLHLSLPASAAGTDTTTSRAATPELLDSKVEGPVLVENHDSVSAWLKSGLETDNPHFQINQDGESLKHKPETTPKARPRKTSRTPILPPGVASPQLNRRKQQPTSSSSPRSPTRSHTIPHHLHHRRHAPNSPSSVGHSRATSLEIESGLCMRLSQGSLGEAFEFQPRDRDRDRASSVFGKSYSRSHGNSPSVSRSIGTTLEQNPHTGQQDEIRQRDTRHSLAFSVLSSMSMGSLRSNSVHEATVQRATTWSIIGARSSILGRLGEDVEYPCHRDQDSGRDEDGVREQEQAQEQEHPGRNSFTRSRRGRQPLQKDPIRTESTLADTSTHIIPSADRSTSVETTKTTTTSENMLYRSKSKSSTIPLELNGYGHGYGYASRARRDDARSRVNVSETEESDSSCSALHALDKAARKVAMARLGSNRERERAVSGLSRFEDAD